ncbi:BrnA antitoxin family protein [Allochromatium tepidum]|uniref:BrnA antitoxin family protein n=1 Tax=Allochromatium tepidum TaxID=553982 RepID=A0ABN6GDG0_9GAMM|nr:BrnA antitoxin family protein [Allochromatium tepidum]BCU07502.1 hypothetical protein Atep_21790 [Allochromatium tepidum]
MIDAAPEMVSFDPDSPPTRPDDWKEALFVPGGGYPAVKAALEQRRRTRGPQKTPKKVPTTIRFDADVLQGLRATGKGWQTRVNEAMREWLERRG